MLYFTADEALKVVKRHADNLSPYSFTYDKDGNVIEAIVDSREEFLLGLANLIVHLIEKETNV